MIKKLSYIQYWDVNDLYGWTMLQQLLVNNFEWMKGAFQFNVDFIKKLMFNILQKLNELHNDLPFLA